MIGSFGQEFLLAGEDGMQRGVAQVVGTANSTALPLVYLTTENVLIGEELYAAEAYLARSPGPAGRLLTQDTLRTVVIATIVLLLLYTIVGAPLGRLL
jgi:hypothetical protein